MNLRYVCQNCGGEANYNERTNTVECQSCGSTNFEYITDEKCPKCNGTLGYNESNNTIYCKECDYKQIEEKQDIPETDDTTVNRTSKMEEFHSNGVTCTGCGAELIVEPNTASFKCPYCESIINVSTNIVGFAKPDLIIPFKFDLAEAQQKFIKWCKKGFFLKKDFKYADRIQELKPIFIPFWIYDIDSIGSMDIEATKTRHYSKGNYDYTETSYYRCIRDFDVSFNNIPCDASKKMDDKSMDLLEPFDMTEIKDFNLGYLSGVLTEKYDFKDTELLNRAYNRSKNYLVEYLKQDIRRSGLTPSIVSRDNARMKNKNARYILLPIWVFSYNYNGEIRQFLMNGQTGKIIGKPPLNYVKIFGLGSTLGIISSIITMLIVL